MRPCAETLRVVLAALIVAVPQGAGFAQGSDVPRPPRIERRAEAPPAPANAAPALPLAGPTPPPISGSPRPPNAATLAPLPEERTDKPEEIIVFGQGWRLPDLGSEWRKKQEEAEDSGRFHVTFLPLYDPSRPPQRSEMMLPPAEWQRHGYIELFRMRFGKRAPKEKEE